MSMKSNSILHDWPPLAFDEWVDTRDTLHMWTQIVGKTRMALTRLENHWWNVVLDVTPAGLTTGPIPYAGQTFEIEFDFIGHCLAIRTSSGKRLLFPLFARAVADFYAEYMMALRSLGIEVHIDPAPSEFDDNTPHDQDWRHKSYDKTQVENFRLILCNVDRILKTFKSRFIGKCSPVHFFWGGFDIAVTRFSGKRAPVREGADRMTQEGYSHEVISCGFWPGDRRFKQAAFYSYTAPAPKGLELEKLPRNRGYWDTELGEFLFKYDDARQTDSPAEAILDFCQNTYEAGARLAGWDRSALERFPPSS